ncbi:phage protein [Gluconobacter frateurii M-2]|nr:phage protein [Gluconobacter frateurii M-2]
MTVSATQRTQLSDAFLMQRDNLTLQALGAVMVQVWAQLVMHLITNTSDGVLNVSFPGTLSALARTRLFCDENLIETYLKTYAETQLITWDAKTGVIGLPAELKPSRRAEASRANGRKGGRLPGKSKKGKVQDNQQGYIPLPISGGKDVTRENLAKTPLTRAPAKAKLSSLSSSEDKLRLDAAFNRIGKKAYDAAELDPARDMGNYGLARQWCADGLAKGLTEDEIERLILFVVREVSAREKAKGNGISFGYFHKAVTQAIARGDVPEAPKTLDQLKGERAWEEAMADYNQRRACGEMNLRRPELSDFVTQVAA